MQTVQHNDVTQDLTLPFESMTDSELAHYCYNLIPNIPQAAAAELVARLEMLAETNKIATKYK